MALTPAAAPDRPFEDPTEPADAVPAAFFQALYRNVPPDDLARRSPEALQAAARSLWEFMAERVPGRAKLRLLDPLASEAGYQGRTILEIVNDDMPFLVDSITACLTQRQLSVLLAIHPVIAVQRDHRHRVERVIDDTGRSDLPHESVMRIEIAGALDAAARTAVADDLAIVLKEVRAAVIDWAPMVRKVEAIAAELGGSELPFSPADIAEAADFLGWVAQDNFLFLGYREYALTEAGMHVVPEKGRGVLRDDNFLVFDGIRDFSHVPPDVQAFLRSPQLLLITKSNRRSKVHRPAHLDTICVKSFDTAGAVSGQRLILGLFTSVSYNRPPSAIPILRGKVQRVIDRSGLAPDSHDGKSLQHLLDIWPRDELFQIDDAQLYETALGVLHLQERQRVALFARRDPFERFVSCLVYVPRDRYSSEVGQRLGDELEAAYGGVPELASVHLDDGALARLHFLVRTVPGKIPEVPAAEVEAKLAAAARTFGDLLHDALVAAHGEAGAQALLAIWRDAFPAGYAERMDGVSAVADIARIERGRTALDDPASAAGWIGLSLDRTAGAAPDELRLKIFHAGRPVALSDVLPMLENLGLRVINETPFELTPTHLNSAIWSQEFELSARGGAAIDLETTGALFEAAFPLVWSGELENDGFNRLVLLAGLSAREIVILRSYAKIWRQAGTSFSQTYMEDTLAAYPEIARDLVRLFQAQFQLGVEAAERTASREAISARIEAALDAVGNLDEDRILRSLLLLVERSLRTNFYRRDAAGNARSYLAIKLASQSIELLPKPRPLYEIYVYSPRMEGIHLRGGRVARGGIRWSDRKEDFRSEILGLMKAQQVKNAVIVPVGSKGGFVVKRPPAERAALQAEVVACYRTLISGLLDLTDSVEGAKIVPPPDIVRLDGDDPYLVVAADKGTATFSDIANGLALDYGFWLGDAFASGGSIGYDHKKMGITARGAWEAVKRHFRELGLDIQTTPFTVVGVGDMSGDVFGNGMLLSPAIELVAAFDHRHIFIDPHPDPAASFAERKRLFDLPQSSWADYDRAVLSPGGGIYPRSVKTVHLSPEARACFGIEAEALSPPELMRILLKHTADLLWFGGIGTYVKASSESHLEAADRANDPIRIDGSEIGARVVGEGANLAMTQRGRIEYAARGGRVDTDAIDNSAGVDTSDHEVNIKIGLAAMIASGRVAPAERPDFLAAMTDEVAALVLEDNYLQTLALSLAEAEAAERIDEHRRLMSVLERAGRLDRALEYLPDDETLAQRQAARRGLTRPELSVLLAYAKNTLYADLLETDLPDDPAFETDLLDYFPKAMVARSRADLERHRLRREIVATHIVNEAINRLGPALVAEMQTKTGRATADIVRAYRIARDVLVLPPLWREIEALDGQVPAALQTELFLAVQHAAEEAVRWFLLSAIPLEIGAVTQRFGPSVAKLRASMAEILPPAELRRLAEARQHYAGAGEALAQAVAALGSLGSAMDIVRLDEVGVPDLVEMGRLYFIAGEELAITALRAQAQALPPVSAWARLARGAVLDDLVGLHRETVARILAETPRVPAGERLALWLAGRPHAVARMRETAQEVGMATPPQLAMLIVACRQLRTLTAS